MISPALGRSLELYYIDGRPDGMLTAELFNWTGHVLMLPRTQLTQALVRPEAAYAGVYLLLGEREGESLAYVGESEDIGSRIKTHDVQKDWWSTAVLVTTAGNKLNKAHARYLEARLIEEARVIGRMPLDNGTSPARPPLSEADISKMESFLQNILFVLPALRVDNFIQRTRPTTTIEAPPDKPSDGFALFEMNVPAHQLHAEAVLRDGEFIVAAGSDARGNWAGIGYENTTYGRLYHQLRNSGVLEVKDGKCTFTGNYAFTSPSAAASVVYGSVISGGGYWKVKGAGLTYKEWESQQLGKSAE